jgi:NADH dehydrogenase
MNVVVTGANSAVGQAILRVGSTRQDPITLIAAVRSERALKELPPLPPHRVARISYDDPASLDSAFAGASAIIHLAGTLLERPNSTYEQANVGTTRAVAEAAARGRVEKLVLISAVGADAGSPNRYWRSKGEAEAVVRESTCVYTILRVPLLLGPGTEGTAALRRHVSRKTALLPGGGRNYHQPLHVDDVARAAIQAASASVAANRTLQLVGPVSLPDRDLLGKVAHVAGREVRVRSIPIAPLRLVLALRRRLGASGFSPDVLDVITADTRLDPSPAAAELGIQLTGLDEMIGQL